MYLLRNGSLGMMYSDRTAKSNNGDFMAGVVVEVPGVVEEDVMLALRLLIVCEGTGAVFGPGVVTGTMQPGGD